MLATSSWALSDIGQTPPPKKKFLESSNDITNPSDNNVTSYTDKNRYAPIHFLKFGVRSADHARNSLPADNRTVHQLRWGGVNLFLPATACCDVAEGNGRLYAAAMNHCIIYRFSALSKIENSQKSPVFCKKNVARYWHPVVYSNPTAFTCLSLKYLICSRSTIQLWEKLLLLR